MGVKHIMATRYQQVSPPPVHPTPENPVPDIAGCGREEARFLHEIGYRPNIVSVLLREVNLDDLWGMWAIIVESWRFERGMWFRKVKGRRVVSVLRSQLV